MVIPVATAEYGLGKTARPFDSRLYKIKLAEAGFKLPPNWQDELRHHLKEIGQ